MPGMVREWLVCWPVSLGKLIGLGLMKIPCLFLIFCVVQIRVAGRGEVGGRRLCLGL